MEHQPIDYTKWDFSGLGDNVFPSLSYFEKEIWEAALPHQDKRDDTGHAESVTYFALKLLDQVDIADRSVVIPAAILHDIGWSQMSETELKLFYDRNWERYEPILRARHQEEGVYLAGMILKNVDHPTEKSSQILDIISQHDTLLEAYGTPWNFVSSTEYKRTEIEFSGKRFPATLITAKNNARRRELMAQQKKYHPLQEAEEYGVRLSLDDCFLCENIVQGVDAQNDSGVKDNVMYDLGMHLIMPNRYPSQFGHSLSVLVNHDDTSARVTPVPDSANKTTIYMPEEGKTRGNVMTEEYLRAIVDACDSLDLFAFRNHVLDGMSIPGHDHFHLFPEDLPPFSVLEDAIGEKERTDFGATIYKPQNTPFDTLLICEEEGGDLVEVAVPILQRLELDDQVFTLNYNKGRLFVSPRHQEEVNDRRIQVGSGIDLHYLDSEGPEFVERIERYVPMKGQFDWGKFIP